MARHNREGEGTDQRGFSYQVNYQPDWLRRVKVTRLLESGRQSTMILFRNPATCRERVPGDRIRTRIRCPEQNLDVEVTVEDTDARVKQVRVSCEVGACDGGAAAEEVVFTLENALPARGASDP